MKEETKRIVATPMDYHDMEYWDGMQREKAKEKAKDNKDNKDQKQEKKSDEMYPEI